MEKSYLRSCNALYEEMLQEITEIEQRYGPEAALGAVERLARFAWEIPTGRFADGRLENIAFRIGQSLEPVQDTSSVPPHEVLAAKGDGRRKVLHIATTVLGVGGHTKLIANWIQKDPDSCHVILLVNQRNWPVPDWLQQTVAANGGEIISFPPERRLTKARWLRWLVQSYAPLIVMHHHPDDAVPIVAFAAGVSCPVAIMNHADHVFWMGNSVGDAVIDARPYGPGFSKTRRFARNSLFLPLPLNPPKQTVKREEARRTLGIPDDQVVLLSIGQAYKYTPTVTHNFYATAIKILDANPEAHLYLIGVSADEKVDYLQSARHDRLHLLGVIEDPSLYRSSADLYLEGYPLGSPTAMLETAMLGVCPVLSYAPTSLLLVANDIAFEGVAEHAPTEQEYIEKVGKLIRDPAARMAAGAEARQRIIEYHIGAKWHECLAEVYRWLESNSHLPSTLPAGNCVETTDDQTLSHFSQKVYDPVYLASWNRRIVQCAADLAALVPESARFILVDEYQFEGQIAPERAIPFTEKNGAYGGPPADDEEAIRELTRLQDFEPSHIVVGWPAFWWLTYYTKFADYIRAHFPCVLENDRLIVFALVPPQEPRSSLS